MARETGPGWCPFTDQLEGLSPNAYSDSPRSIFGGFCDHTAGGFYSTLHDVNFWNRQGYSVNFGVSLKGEAVQIVNIFEIAYGQGRLGPPPVTWPPYYDLGDYSPNPMLISTEHEDCVSINGVTKYLPPIWTPEMYDADLAIKQWCIEEVLQFKGFDMRDRGIDMLAGHHMFDRVGRANCPGPYWPRQRLWDDLKGSREMEYFPLNATAASMAGLGVRPEQAIVISTTAFDHQPPTNAKFLNIEVYSTGLNSGEEPELQIYHGTSGGYAGNLGWGRGGLDAYGLVPMVKLENGQFTIRGLGKILVLGLVGYWK